MVGGGKTVGKAWSIRKGEKLKPEGYRYVGQELVLALKGAHCGVWMRRVIGDRDVLRVELCPLPKKLCWSPNPQYPRT